MAYTTADKLPEDFFQDMIQEKAEMIWKYLKEMGNPLVFTHWAKYGHIQILFTKR